MTICMSCEGRKEGLWNETGIASAPVTYTNEPVASARRL